MSRIAVLAAPHRRERSAFTLIELLVVIAILALLVSILLPSLQKAKDLAMQAVCLSTLRAHGTQIALYTTEHDGMFPTPALSDEYQWRWYWNTMKDPYYPDEGDNYDGVDMNWICPGIRKNWQNPPWQLQPHICGYQQNFVDFSGVNYAPSRYRSLGGHSIMEVGSDMSGTPASSGALVCTSPSRMIALCDAGFNYAMGGTFAFQTFGHEESWGALFVDGHANMFTEANLTTNWYEYYRLISDLSP